MRGDGHEGLLHVAGGERGAELLRAARRRDVGVQRGHSRLDVGANDGRLVVDRLGQRLAGGRSAPEVLPGTDAAGVRDGVELEDPGAEVVEFDLRAVLGPPQLGADQYLLAHVRFDRAGREAVSVQVVLQVDRDGRGDVTRRLDRERDVLVLPGRVGHRQDEICPEAEAERDQSERDGDTPSRALELGHGLASHVRRERLSHISLK
ncbi:MAG TPA: hypothetical protein VJ841_04430 [Candidatus Saccharimonadales bacterium]|nr:hypothetical protein [Candidatus Saccharimonadales bacterium]